MWSQSFVSTVTLLVLFLSSCTLVSANRDPQKLREALNAGLRAMIEKGTWEMIQTTAFGSSPSFPPAGCTDDGNTYDFPPQADIQGFLDAGEIVFGYKLSPPRVVVDPITMDVTGNIAEIAKATVQEIALHYNVGLVATFQPTSNAFGYFPDFLATLADIGPKIGADVALGPLSITEERAESVYYTCSFTTINFSFVRSSLDMATVNIATKEDFAGKSVSVIEGSTEEAALRAFSQTLPMPINIQPMATAEMVLQAASEPNPTVIAALLNTPAAKTYAIDNQMTCGCMALDFELLNAADADRIGFATDRYDCALPMMGDDDDDDDDDDV